MVKKASKHTKKNSKTKQKTKVYFPSKQIIKTKNLKKSYKINKQNFDSFPLINSKFLLFSLYIK